MRSDFDHRFSLRHWFLTSIGSGISALAEPLPTLTRDLKLTQLEGDFQGPRAGFLHHM